MLPSATDLRYFAAVVKTLNVRRAAEQLRIAQPSLSIAIQRLECALGVSLLIRFKGGVRLTRAGEDFAINARALLKEWERACSEAAKHETEVRGRYVIGCPLELGLIAVPESLVKLFRIHPDLEVGLVQDAPERVIEDVVNFKIDFGIVAEPTRHPDLLIRRICSEEIRMWVGNGRQPTQDPQSDQAVLVYDPAFSRWLADANKKITFRRIITATNVALVARLVAAGAGIGILSNHVAVALGAAGMHPLPQDLFSLSHDICLIYRSDAQRTPASRRLARDIETTLRETMCVFQGSRTRFGGEVDHRSGIIPIREPSVARLVT
jgi:LysR family transcriptional regulator, cell division regulator